MDIIISNSSSKPIYEQITSQVKNMILTGQLKEGAPLPSMRLLAKELRISVITTKRAYEDLERDGFIETVVGKGSFVAKRTHSLCAKKFSSLRRNTLKRRSTQQNPAVLRRASCTKWWISFMKRNYSGRNYDGKHTANQKPDKTI